MVLGITSKGGGVIRVKSGGRLMNQRLRKRERGVCNKLSKRKRKNGDEQSKGRLTLGLLRDQKIKEDTFGI